MNDTQVSTGATVSDGTEADAQIVAYLEDLLSRQLEKLRKYDLDGAGRLAEESEEVSRQIAGRGLLDRASFRPQRDRIRELYRQLCLVIATERQEVSEKLKQIREGIRALSKYSE